VRIEESDLFSTRSSGNNNNNNNNKYILSIMLLLVGAEDPSSGRYPNNLKGRINSKANDGSLTSHLETLKGKEGGIG
jgi:hypothetical protein